MPSEEMMILISAREAAMSEKTITRYFPNRNYAFMEDHPNGAYVQFHDHEAALAAEREQYEARIAELERERNSAIREETSTYSDRVDFEEAFYNLRDAIEAKAREWDEQALARASQSAALKLSNPAAQERKDCANELRALLGEGK